MAGSAVLLDNLVDDLVPTIDELRDELHADFGVRQFDVFVVKRLWDGDCIGEGTATIEELEITPSPLVVNWPGTDFRMAVYGREEEGDIHLREVSLTYTDTELSGLPLLPKQETYYRLRDKLGQGIQDRFYVLRQPPFTDRERDIGWKVYLRRAEIQE